VEQAEVWTELAEPPLRAGFRVSADHELVCTLVNAGAAPAYLAVTTSRTARRWADLDVAGTLDGVPLTDPAAGAGYFGGPATAVLLGPGEADVRTVPLAAYVDLARSAVGRLELRCTRRVGLGPDDVAVFTHPPAVLEVDLAVDLA
jgi:hypothetical protein